MGKADPHAGLGHSPRRFARHDFVSIKASRWRITRLAGRQERFAPCLFTWRISTGAGGKGDYHAGLAHRP